MEEKYLTERQLRDIIKTFPLEEKDYLTTNQVADLFWNSVSRINRFALKQIKNAPLLPSVERYGKNGKYRMFSIEDVVNFYIENKYLFSPKLIDDKEHRTIYIEADKTTQENYYYDRQGVTEKQDNLINHEREASNNAASSFKWFDESKLLEAIKSIVAESSKSIQNQDLSWYIEELKKQIEDTKNEKEKVLDELKKEKELLISEKQELNDKYIEETKRVEKVYFISDRYDKVMNNHKAIMMELIRMSKSLTQWEQIKLWELKKLALQLSTNEKVEISESGDIKFLQSSDSEYLSDFQEISDEVILEKSREGEFNNLKRQLKTKNIFLIISISILVLLVIIFAFYRTKLSI